MTQNEIKDLIEKYPYLMPRNVWTDKIPDGFDYSYIRGIGELPPGWNKLFLQMCEDIRQPLKEAGYIEKFRFTQIKEKWGRMRCYHVGATVKVNDIIAKYENMSHYICSRCGKPANYKTLCYVETLCEECWKDIGRHEAVESIEFKPSFIMSGFNEDTHYYEKKISFEKEWERYLKNIRGDV